MSEETDRNEIALVGSALLEPGRVMPLLMGALASAEWFADRRCKSAWRGLRQLWDENGLDGADLLTVADALKRVKPEKGEEAPEIEIAWVQKIIDDTPSAAHAEYYLNIVRDQYLCRKGKRLAQGFAASLETGPALAIQKFQSGLVEIMSEATGQQDAALGETGKGVMKTFKEAHQIRMVEKRMDYCPGIPAPWRVMTANYNGLQPGLHVLAARPSTGKTALVGNMIRFWCEGRGLHVGFNSLDMQPRQFMKRVICEKSRVSLAKAEFGTTSERDLARLESAASESVAKWPLRVTVKRDLEAFRSWCVMRRLKGELDVAVVDFMQLMEFDGCYRMGSDDRVSRISGTLKAIGNDLDIPVIALSQLNRQCEEDGGREPQLSDLRGSGAIEQDAFTVMFLHTDPRVHADWQLCPPIALSPFGATLEARQYTAKQLRPVMALLKKNQNGRTGRLPLVLFPNYFLFMMGDYNAEPVWEYDNAGNRKKTPPNNAPLFGRVIPDWRADAMEEAIAKSGGLVTEYRDGE
jgi:replicative DNA helicase